MSKVKTNVFTKEQILKSNLYGDYRDYLKDLLVDGKLYTKDEINEIIKEVK